MKKGLLLPALLFIVFCSANGAAQTQPAPDPVTKRGQEIIAMIAKWAEAIRDRDQKALGAILDDEVIVTTHEGKTRGKAQELEALKPNPNIRYSSVDNEDVTMKLFGDIAVVTGLRKMRIAGARTESRLNLRYTAVFAKRDGEWLIVALQTARVPQTAA